MLRNTALRWGWPAQLLHWLIAALVLTLLPLGWVMVDLVSDLQRKLALYQLHKSLGLTVLTLAVLRLAWRALNRAPDLPPDTPAWEALAARGTHAALYLLLLAIPLSGFLMAAASTLGIPTVWFGVLAIPHPIAPSEAAYAVLRTLHDLLGKLLVLLLALHVAGALRHHLVLRDDVLRRMLPGQGPRP